MKAYYKKTLGHGLREKLEEARGRGRKSFCMLHFRDKIMQILLLNHSKLTKNHCVFITEVNIIKSFTSRREVKCEILRMVLPIPIATDNCLL